MRNNYSTLNNVWVFKTKPQPNSIETCKNDLLPLLKQVNTAGRDSITSVGSCTFPRYSANLQDYGACPLPITSCGPNMLTGVTYENKQCKAPISCLFLIFIVIYMRSLKFLEVLNFIDKVP